MLQPKSHDKTTGTFAGPFKDGASQDLVICECDRIPVKSDSLLSQTLHINDIHDTYHLHL